MTASEPNAKTMSIRVASYNIREPVGLDWRRDGERIVRVLAEIDSDIVVLQEADRRLGTRPGVLPTKMLSDDLGYEFADFDPESPSHGWHGNAILFRSSRFSLVRSRKISLPTLEPRGAVSAVFETPVFEIIGVHLGLTPGTRRKQLRALADHAAHVERPVLIAGDFNSALANEQIEGLSDSRLTTHANLAWLDAMGIAFLTLRRRTARTVAALLVEPPEAWRRITLTNVGRIYRNPRILERRLRIRDYPGEIRQIAVTDLGYEKPTLLLSNQMDEPASRLVDRYARRMVIKNTIADAIDFFHMDARSAAVPMRIDLDVQPTLMASSLYRLLGIRVGQGFEVAKARTIFRKLVNASAADRITEGEIIFTLGRRANNPLLLAARYGEIAQPIPWLGNRTLRTRFF